MIKDIISGRKAALGCTLVHWNYVIISWNLSEAGFVQIGPASNMSQSKHCESHRVHQVWKLFTVLVSESLWIT